MTQVVTLKIGEGNFETGFKVEMRIDEEDQYPPCVFSDHFRLPAAPTIPDYYQCWLNRYQVLDKQWRGRAIRANTGDAQQLIIQCQNAATDFKTAFKNWLASSDQREFQSMREKLCENLDKNADEIRVIIQTNEPLLKKLPWHEWDLFADNYTNAEIAVGATVFERIRGIDTSDQLRILVILGNSEGIEIGHDRQVLEDITRSSQAKIKFLPEPNQADISDRLWKDQWNIFCFSGHSSSKDETGQIFINRTDSLTIKKLKEGLRKAIERGLQLAIFNSCDGLKLAEDLADLNIPLVIFMREPVVDKVAHAFFKYFLEQFSQGEPLYLAVRQARGRLIELGYDNDFPGSSCLPVIFQNPAVKPPTWKDLGGLPKPPNPYRYLSPFCEEDSEYFFGREPVIDRLQNLVEQQNFVMVLGTSGSGKSSVVFAGLVPRLRQQKHWLIAHLRPQSDPFGQLDQALVPLLHTETLEDDENQIKLSQMVQNISQRHPKQRLLVIIDQFEELYTSNLKEVQDRFIEQLLQVIETTKRPTGENGPQFTLLITLRADFLGKVLDYAPFANRLEDYPNDIKLGSMVRAGLRSAIEKPAKKQKVTIEADLTNRILQDVGEEPGNLSLLEFALARLWEKMSGDTMTLQNYEAIGGVKQAITKYANDFYENLAEKEQAILRHVMVQLVQPGEGTQNTRQVATGDQIGEENWHLLIPLLVEKRLVVIEQNKDKQDTVELVHEALIHYWPLLKDWINEHHENCNKDNEDNDNCNENHENCEVSIMRDYIERAAKNWEAHGKAEDYLLQDPKLSIAEEYFNVNQQ